MSLAVKRLALVGAVFALMLSLGECIVRIFRPQSLSIWAETRDGLSVHRPNAAVTIDGLRITTNGHGMRDREHAREKPAGTTRVMVLGDSFMEAHQVALEDAFPRLLEGALEAREPECRWEVVNAAVSGWGTDDELTYLRRYGMALAPDVVIVVMTLHNDISDNLRERFHTFRDGLLRERPRVEKALAQHWLQRVKEAAAGHSHLYRLAYLSTARGELRRAGEALDTHVSAMLTAPESMEIQRGRAMTLALLDSMHETVARAGARLLVVLIPLQLQIETHGLDVLAREAGVDPRRIDGDVLQRELKTWGERRAIPVVDLLPRFRREVSAGGSRLGYVADGHWSTLGHRIAVSEVVGAVPACVPAAPRRDAHSPPG
jgi:lysophospholipase L1-like esterase